MTYVPKSLDELHELALAEVRAGNPNAVIAKGSDHWLKTRAMAAVVLRQQHLNLRAENNILPTDADPSALPEHARNRMGDEGRYLPAAPAQGRVLVLADVINIPIPAGTILTHASGARYRVVNEVLTDKSSFLPKSVVIANDLAEQENLTRLVVSPNVTGVHVDLPIAIGSASVVRAVKGVLPDSSSIELWRPLLSTTQDAPITTAVGCIVDLEALQAGAAGTLTLDDTLTFETPIDQVQATVTVLETTQGRDLETPEELRRRILAWMQDRPGAGTGADYRAWALATPGVDIEDACVYFGARGLGTIDIVPIGRPGARQTSPATIVAIAASVRTVMPAQDDMAVRSIIDGEGTTTLDVTLELATGGESRADWTGSYTVDADSTSQNVQLTTAPSDVPIGARVLVFVSNLVFRGLYQRHVISKGSTSIMLNAPLPAAPSAGSVVDPGGPVAQIAIDELNRYFDNIGPGDPDGHMRFPTSEVWDWFFRRERLSAAVLGGVGIKGCRCVTPTINSESAEFARIRPGTFRVLHIDD